ncbi:MAG: H-type small acid-soluble spore protein [Anaeromicrobium sp.]|jgi:H-type small acid-soluble spore protein|uniref:H-type small acid-soluble spore protein n=1 Tax=Anaeromicrobium sp. TaxID=1929132 RepID=UPI0025E22C0A|nr:H-type small acid-soluble spore protein [Anaeromicrobium sp.]MCT4593861.1 H-type small acid-soluble spore protein [Anaeromicrobium sp.]
MKYKRAKEILENTGNITVLYNGESIWIENIDPKTSTALITTFDEEVIVPIKELYEH